MPKIDVIRAWKDEDYRMSLSEAERASLPANPVGMIELTEQDLDSVAGGATLGCSWLVCTLVWPVCTDTTTTTNGSGGCYVPLSPGEV